MTEGRLAPEEVRTRTFTRVVRGYKRREVRRLLERAADDLDRLRNGPTTNTPDDEPPLTPEAVEEARFQPALGGYEMEEVDEFLDRVVAELDRAAREPIRPPSALPAPPRVGLFPPPAREVRVAGSGGAEPQARVSEVEPEAREGPESPVGRAAGPPVAGRDDEPEVGREAVPGAGPGVAPAVSREGTSPPPDPDAALAADQWMEPGARTEPPLVERQPPAAGPLPASLGRAGAGPLPAAQPPPAGPHPAPPPTDAGPASPPGDLGPASGPPPDLDPAAPSPAGPPPTSEPAPEQEPAPPSPAWAVDEEGFFPPPTVPPSAAPAATPPPPPPSARPPVVPAARPLTPSEVETQSFDRGAPGYLPNHVDLFLAKAARALAGRDGETLTRWDVLRQRFPLGPRGYATSEVDAFLVRLAAQFPDPDPAAQEEILRKLFQRTDGP